MTARKVISLVLMCLFTGLMLYSSYSVQEKRRQALETCGPLKSIATVDALRAYIGREHMLGTVVASGVSFVQMKNGYGYRGCRIETAGGVVKSVFASYSAQDTSAR